MSETTNNLQGMVAEVAAAYFSNTHVTKAEIGEVIREIASSLASVGDQPKPDAATPEESLKPTAAQIRRSITPEALISFEDGKPYKTLRRHLATKGMTPQDYCAKHGLPADYPMVAASYSARRSELAKSLGLGQQGRGGRVGPARRGRRGPAKS